ncbi:hypothetical protein D3C87_2166240 [compost metagenome]
MRDSGCVGRDRDIHVGLRDEIAVTVEIQVRIHKQCLVEKEPFVPRLPGFGMFRFQIGVGILFKQTLILRYRRIL